MLQARTRAITQGPRLGKGAYLACLVACILMATLAQGWRVAFACAIGLLLAFVFYRPGLEPLRKPWLWMFCIFLLVPAALTSETIDWTISGVGIGYEGLVLGLQMALRAITILVAVTGFAASVSISELAGMLEAAGVKGLGFAMGVAVNVLPIVQETATTTFHALRLRGGFRRQRLQGLRLLLVTIVVNSLRHAEDIVSAAEARAFSVERSCRVRSKWQPSDLLLATGLAAVALLVLWI